MPSERILLFKKKYLKERIRKMNKKEIELRKDKIRQKINISYRPRPSYIDIWKEEGYESFNAICKQKGNKKDHVTLSTWNTNDLDDIECIEEIPLTKETYKHIYFSTALHKLQTEGL